VRRFGGVVLAGFVGGSLCGCLVLIPMLFFGPHDISEGGPAQRLTDILNNSPFYGIEFGGAFGVIIFPLCYYLFLWMIPLERALWVTFPSSVIAGWLALFLPLYRTDIGILGAWWLLAIFGPSFLGLLVSCIVLSRMEWKEVGRG
jgi:hypothetical protein